MTAIDWQERALRAEARLATAYRAQVELVCAIQIIDRHVSLKDLVFWIAGQEKLGWSGPSVVEFQQAIEYLQRNWNLAR